MKCKVVEDIAELLSCQGPKNFVGAPVYTSKRLTSLMSWSLFTLVPFLIECPPTLLFSFLLKCRHWNTAE
jgi:hypothetical protein